MHRTREGSSTDAQGRRAFSSTLPVLHVVKLRCSARVSTGAAHSLPGHSIPTTSPFSEDVQILGSNQSGCSIGCCMCRAEATPNHKHTVISMEDITRLNFRSSLISLTPPVERLQNQLDPLTRASGAGTVSRGILSLPLAAHLARRH